MLFMWVLGIILGVIIVVCLIFGWYSMDNYAPKKRVLILSGIVAGIVVFAFLVCFLADILGAIGLYLLCTIAFLGPILKGSNKPFNTCYMKKLVLLMLLAFGFLSCSKSGDELNLSLANTTWTSSYGSDESVVLEFAEKSVVFFKADKQLNIKGDAQSGTYSYDGEVVKFNLNGKPWHQWTFKEGVVTGNTMFVTYDQYSYNPDTGKYDDFMFEDDRTFRKL